MISIVVCSANDSMFEQFTRNVESTIGVPHEIIRIDNRNSEFSICQAYNKGIMACRYDIICFIHEDVLFYTNQWGTHLAEIFTIADIGLAGVYGACYLGLFPNAWIDMDECQGQIIEGFKEGKPVKRSMRFPEHPLTEVVAIDGVFMATRKNLMNTYSFPENILRGFHGYDMDISMHLHQHNKVVVTSDILMVHFSNGSYNATYYDAYKTLFRKWKSFLPAYIPAYSKKNIVNLKLKSLNPFPKQSKSFLSKFKNKLQAARYALENGVFLIWLSNKFKIIKGKTKTNAFIPNDESYFDKGYSKTLIMLNNYFNSQPQQRAAFKKELEFINNIPKHVPSDEKLLHTIIPYPFILDYSFKQTEVFLDEDCSMFYVIMGKHRLYYHKGFKNKEDVQRSFTYISIEQHPDSPHRYLDNEFRVDGNDVVVDIGAAEGNFSLMIADIVKELIIVESDTVWMEALHKTFEPWKEKVTIINKLIGGENDEKTITLDKLCSRNKITAVKMDVEGSEVKVLHQSQNYIRENNFKLAITLYHRYSDEADIQHLLNKNQYQTTFSKGYIFFIYGLLRPPYFRRGLIKAFKSQELIN